MKLASTTRTTPASSNGSVLSSVQPVHASSSCSVSTPGRPSTTSSGSHLVPRLTGPRQLEGNERMVVQLPHPSAYGLHRDCWPLTAEQLPQVRQFLRTALPLTSSARESAQFAW